MAGYLITAVNENHFCRYLATTQFEDKHARSAFICYDEPEYKATFAVKLTIPDAPGYHALSNGLVKETIGT